MSMNLILKAATLFHSLTGIEERFASAWMCAENGYTWCWTNNPANISYQGRGIPRGGVFDGVVKVLPNKVVVYKDLESGVRAWAMEMNMTCGPRKWLTIDTHILLSCRSLVEMCRKLGESNWAGSHYVGQFNTWRGGSIWEAYHSSVMSTWYGSGVHASESSVGVSKVNYGELPILKSGTPHSGCVKAVQAVIGVKADGMFGPGTETALTAWKKAHGLPAVALVDSETWARLLS